MVPGAPLSVLCSRLGYPKGTASVIEIIERSPSTVVDIARATHIHRPQVYRILAALTKKNIARTERTGKRDFYHLVSRTLLYNEFVQMTDAFSKPDTPWAHITHLTSKTAVADFFTDVLRHSRKGDTFYRYTSERDVDAVNAQLSPSYRSERDKKKLERLVISNALSAKQKKPRLERFIKFLDGDREAFDHNIIQLVYANRVSILDLSTKKGIIIENDTFAAFQKTIFKALYKRL
jgi:hypothetical protein